MTEEEFDVQTTGREREREREIKRERGTIGNYYKWQH